VLVDGSYSKNDKGEIVYAARPKEDLDRIATLVRSAIGFDQKRGDQVEIVNLRFAESPSVIPTDTPKGFLGMFQFTKDDIMYFVELGVMLILGLIVVFMVVRPLLKRVLASDPAAAIPAPLPALPETPVPTPQQISNATSQMIDVAQVQGQVHAQSVHRVGELADRNPNETATIIRQWLSEPA